MEDDTTPRQEPLSPEEAQAKDAILAECENLAAAGVTFVAVHFDGYGDSGVTEEVKCFIAEKCRSTGTGSLCEAERLLKQSSDPGCQTNHPLVAFADVQSLVGSFEHDLRPRKDGFHCLILDHEFNRGSHRRCHRFHCSFHHLDDPFRDTA